MERSVREGLTNLTRVAGYFRALLRGSLERWDGSANDVAWARQNASATAGPLSERGGFTSF